MGKFFSSLNLIIDSSGFDSMLSYQVIFSIALCYFASGTPLDLHLRIVGDVDTGMRAPFFPDFGKTGEIIFSAFSIAIVSFVIHIALAKLIAKEYNYQINVNQVLIDLTFPKSMSIKLMLIRY